MKSSAFKLSLFVLAFSLLSFSGYADDQRETWPQTKPGSSYASAWAAPQENSSQDPLPDLEKLRRRMGEFINQGLEDFQKKGYLENQNGPQTDILEKDGSFYLLLDLPGVKKNEINIEVKGQDISISGDRKVEEDFKVSNLIKIERRYGNFQRVYTIPEEFVADQITAKYENGVLQVKIPKKKVTAEVVKPKTIAIS